MRTFRRFEQAIDAKTGQKVRVVDHSTDQVVIVRANDGKTFRRFVQKLAKLDEQPPPGTR